MKRIFGVITLFLLMFLTSQVSFAKESKLLVLPDNLQFESTNYYVYPDASTIFATDTINYLKKANKVTPVSMVEIRDVFRKNQALKQVTKNALKEYKYNYNVSFIDLRKIAQSFGADKILVITSTTDSQNYVLRRSVFDLLNISGCTSINPAYKLSTYVTLVDIDKEEILWQANYHKTLSMVENRIIAVNFAPAISQLEKIKFYSQYYISPLIAANVQSKLVSVAPVSNVNGIIVPKSLDINVPNIQNINFEHPKQMDVKPINRPNLMLKQDTNNIMINDI